MLSDSCNKTPREEWFIFPEEWLIFPIPSEATYPRGKVLNLAIWLCLHESEFKSGFSVSPVKGEKLHGNGSLFGKLLLLFTFLMKLMVRGSELNGIFLMS